MAHRFHGSMNDPRKRNLFQNKVRFLEHFGGFVKREFLDVANCGLDELDRWLRNHTRFVAKPVDGVVGRGVQLLDSAGFDSADELRAFLYRYKLLLLEEEIVQHVDLQRLNPKSVNTVRIITVLQDETVHIIGTVLRMSLGSFVDNLAAGGIAAAVDLETGIVVRPAVSKMPDETKYALHPVTNTEIVGFELPHWGDTLEMIRESDMLVPSIRTVGWDVAITQEGPILVEGNDNWDKTLWQIPYGRGMRGVLTEFHN